MIDSIVYVTSGFYIFIYVTRKINMFTIVSAKDLKLSAFVTIIHTQMFEVFSPTTVSFYTLELPVKCEKSQQLHYRNCFSIISQVCAIGICTITPDVLCYIAIEKSKTFNNCTDIPTNSPRTDFAVAKLLPTDVFLADSFLADMQHGSHWLACHPRHYVVAIRFARRLPS